MVASELRIGNVVKHKTDYINKMYPSFYWRVTNLGVKSFKCKGHSGLNFEPIPLTEEILKTNCGFYIDSHEGVKFISIGRINNSMEIYFVIVGEILVMSIRIDLQFIDLGTRVKYLHQLQNLYKELTMGKELNIKL